MAMRQLCREYYIVGWVCALPIELAAAQLMLDEEDQGLDQDPNDTNLYTLGRIGEHNVVIACLPTGQMGAVSAATVAMQMKSTFPSIRFGLMVGIGGGVPSGWVDIRLGDVVVSQLHKIHGGVVQYDFGKTTLSGFERTGSLNSPPKILLNTVSKIQANHVAGRSSLAVYLSELSKVPEFQRDNAGPDVLFDASYNHAGGPTCGSCSKEMVVHRQPRENQEVVVHYGTIASGNQVMKHGATRDTVSSELGEVLCFEMEAAGLMNDFPCLVIRGICDYADTHKNDKWQPYAAATAAAYAKELLKAIPESQIEVKSMNPNFTLSHGEYNTEVLDRISQTKFWAKQDDVYIQTQRGTGTWILNDRNFKMWLAGQGNTLWCSGIAGTGKTVLTLIIINHLVRTFEFDNFGLAWVYIDYCERNLHTMENLSAGLLQQLVQKRRKISDSIIKAFGGWREVKPKLGEYRTLLQEELQKFKKTFVVIDALDEWGTTHQIKELITELLNLKPATVKPGYKNTVRTKESILI